MSSKTHSGESPGRRVLFVEDEAGLRKAYERFFASRYEMAFAGTGVQAMDELQGFVPDVVVMDMRLPDTDGIELLRRMRAHRADLSVIITTSYVSMEPMVEMLGIGHSGYLVKPFDLDELSARIDAAG